MITCPTCAKSWTFKELKIPNRVGQKAVIACPCGEALRVVVEKPWKIFGWTIRDNIKVTLVRMEIVKK
jgi:hypothetical protein